MLATTVSFPDQPVICERERRRQSSDPRRVPRSDVALQAWAMKPSGTQRAYVLDLSESGARLGGISSGFVLGQGMLLKMKLGNEEGQIIMRAEAVRWHETPEGTRQLGVRFLEVPFDDWFALCRHLDSHR